MRTAASRTRETLNRPPAFYNLDSALLGVYRPIRPPSSHNRLDKGCPTPG